jgi:hypothetical protein
VHTLSDIVVQLALRYVPAAHAPAEQFVHAVAPLVVENEVPAIHAYCFLSPGHDDPILQTVQVPVSSVVVHGGFKYLPLGQLLHGVQAVANQSGEYVVPKSQEYLSKGPGQ